MSTALVILPTATYRAPDFIAAASDLGVDLVVASEADHGLAGQMGDGFVAVDCTDPQAAAESIVDLANRKPLDAIVPADDQGVVAAALAAEVLGLPHNPPEAAAATRDKALMRTLLEAAGVHQPGFRLFRDGDDPLGMAEELGYPCVVKPRGLSGSRGVIRVDGPAGMPSVVERIRRILVEAGGDRHEPLLIEEYVPGFEVALEGLLGPDGLEVLAVLDKPDPLEGPFFEETMFITPSRLSADMAERLAAEVTRAVEALGLTFGPIHAEARIDGDDIRVIEIAARSIGGLCSRSLQFGLLGTSLEHLLLRAALGMPRRGMRRREAASGVMMLPIPAAGVLRRVGWQEAALEVPGVTALEITIPIGREVVPLPEGDRYLGFLFAGGAEPEEVEAALREAHSLLDIVVD